MPIYSQDGVSLLADGDSLRGCCCGSTPPGPSCLGASLQFQYYLANPPGSNLHGLDGNHAIYAGPSGKVLSNTSTFWGSGWGDCTPANTVYFLTGDCTNSGCKGGKANLYLTLGAAQTIPIYFRETRTFEESWSSALVAQVVVSSVQANTRLVVAGTTVTGPTTVSLGTWTKTNSNTIGDQSNATIRVGPWNIVVSAR